jgi:hypothetical protein
MNPYRIEQIISGIGKGRWVVFEHGWQLFETFHSTDEALAFVKERKKSLVVRRRKAK